MVKHTNPLRIRLPRGWPQSVKSAMLHVISLAQVGMAYTCGWSVGPVILARAVCDACRVSNANESARLVSSMGHDNPF